MNGFSILCQKGVSHHVVSTLNFYHALGSFFESVQCCGSFSLIFFEFGEFIGGFFFSGFFSIFICVNFFHFIFANFLLKFVNFSD